MGLRTLPEGHYVKYSHDRVCANPDWLTPLPKGGTTYARIFDANGDLVAKGIATCSNDDNYVKAIGRDIALGRALAQLDGTAKARETRKQSEVEARVIRELAQTFGTF
jgi:hypothetical protein